MAGTTPAAWAVRTRAEGFKLKIFADTLASFGKAPALFAAEGVISYAQLDAMARRIAAEIGPRRQLVFLEATNTPLAIATYLACLIGGHAVHLTGPHRDVSAARLRDIYRPNRVYGVREGVLELLDSHDEAIELHPDLCILLGTSGSTGSPKLVKLSRRNIQSNADAIVEYLQLDAAERAPTSLKFNYSYGLSIINSHLACGAALILTDRSVLDVEFWETFRAHGATSLAGVPYTFEVLHRSGQTPFAVPQLRYMTQAGGRLAPELVRHFASLARDAGWRFYVMYGQTEAAPRMTYLPPEHALQYPDCIGVPIPQGQVFLLDEDEREIDVPDESGELAYAGPNVMLGYATSPRDLATDETPARLLTGDIACRNAAGLYYIVGRSSRFVKPFGIRVNLDDVQARVRHWSGEAVCCGVDETIVIALCEPTPSTIENHLAELSSHYRLPSFAFRVIELKEIPRLANGKTDYTAIKAAVLRIAPSKPEHIAVPEDRGALEIVFSRSFLAQMKRELLHLLGVGEQPWSNVAEIFSTVFASIAIAPTDSFVRLAGDSLSYVQASLALEEYLGRVPARWEHMTVSELEQLHKRGQSF